MNFICKFRIWEIRISYVFFFVRKRNEEGGECGWNSDRFPVFVGDFMREENAKKKRDFQPIVELPLVVGTTKCLP